MRAPCRDALPSVQYFYRNGVIEADKHQKTGSMKNHLLLYAMLLAFGYNAFAQPEDARNVLRKSLEKCQSIQSGHYVMQKKMKYMDGKDTVLTRFTCDFRKMPDDTIFGKHFSLCEMFQDSDKTYFFYHLYTGNEYIQYDNQSGCIFPCDQWADLIMQLRGRCDFYTVIATRSCYPLPDEKQLADNNYTFAISEARLDGKSCHRISILAKMEMDEMFNIVILRYEINLWIDKESFLPLQYSIAYDNLQGKDTMYQYEECKLLSFNPEADTSKITFASIPADVKLRNYVPYQAAEPLPIGTPAPDWSLPTLKGDTVRLADLKGKVVLLDFFYKSCPPCCAAMPFLQSLQEKYGDKGFMVIGIDPKDDPEKMDMAGFLAKRDITYTVLFAGRELGDTYRISAYPTLFFLDREGNIVIRETGFSKTIESAIEEQLLKMF